jgi:hypothetical protein
MACWSRVSVEGLVTSYSPPPHSLIIVSVALSATSHDNEPFDFSTYAFTKKE